MSNAAKKIIEVDLSNKWPVGTVIVERDGKNEGRAYHRSAAVIRLYLGNDRVELLHATGRTTSATIGHVQNKYKIAPRPEASIFAGAQVGAYADSAMGESLGDTVPRGPRSVKANDEESRSEPPPPPAANDTAITVSAQFIEAQREANKRMDKLESMVTSLVALVAGNLQNKAASAPTKTKEQEREEATNKQVNEEMPWARPQLERFIEETMEFVTFATQAEIDRALRPGEVFDQFSLWCDVNNLRVPFQKTVYRALLDNPRTRLRCKLSGTDERTPLAVRRQTRLGFDESQPIGKDVRAIVDHARRAAWPDLKEAHRETIANLLMAKVSKADILVALDYIAAKPGRGKDSYTPDKVLTVKHIGSLVRLARAESDQ